jgi:recombination protein RecT
MSEQTQVATQQPQQNQIVSVKSLLDSADMKSRLASILGERASVFSTSIVQLVNQSHALRNCDPKSVINCAMVATTLNLSINPQLGQAWVIPYGKTAQFQLGYKGLKQLAMRSGQFLRLNCVEIYENQFVSYNALTEELVANFDQTPQGEVVGYCAYMKLINGFEKTVYWTKDKVQKHATKYSKTFKSGPWQSEYDKMAMKTVMKSLLNSGDAPLSIDMQNALKADQAVITNVDSHESFDTDYPDNPIEEATIIPTQEEEEESRILKLIEESKNLASLNKRVESFGDDLKEKYASQINAKRESFVKE